MKKFFILFLLLAMAGSAWAAGTVDWWNETFPAPNQPGRDRDWFNPSNWVWSDNTWPPPGVPTATSEVKMHRTSAAPYDLTCIIATGGSYNPSGNAFASVINIGGVGGNAEPYGRLTINSGSLTVGNGLRVGASSSSRRSGQLFVNGGVINAPAYLAVGYGPGTTSNVTGWLYMTAGTINVNVFDIGRVVATNGYAYISGSGRIDANDFRMRPAGGTGTVLLDITGDAKVVVNGDQVAKVLGYIDSGWIRSGGGEFNPDWVTYNSETNKTTIPEPATLCILALGAFGLIRRKR